MSMPRGLVVLVPRTIFIFRIASAVEKTEIYRVVHLPIRPSVTSVCESKSLKFGRIIFYMEDKVKNGQYKMCNQLLWKFEKHEVCHEKTDLKVFVAGCTKSFWGMLDNLSSVHRGLHWTF